MNMRRKFFANILLSIFIISSGVYVENTKYIKNPQKKPLRVSPYVTEVNFNIE